MDDRIVEERTGTTSRGLRIRWWRHKPADAPEYVTWSIEAGAWGWESEDCDPSVWTWPTVKGLGACLDYLAARDPSEAAALVATIRRNLPTPPGNVVQLDAWRTRG